MPRRTRKRSAPKRSYSSSRTYKPKRKTARRSSPQTVKIVLQHEMLGAPRPVPVLGENGVFGMPKGPSKTSKL